MADRIPRKPLTTEVYEALVAVCGETIYWKRTLKRILRQAGVAQRLVDKTEHLTKFVMAREVLDALDQAGPRGMIVQHNLVNLLANLAGPEDRVPDPDAGRRALERLRAAAKAEAILVDPEKERRRQRQEQAQEARAERSRRAGLIDQARAQFLDLHTMTTNPLAAMPSSDCCGTCSVSMSSTTRPPTRPRLTRSTAA